MEWIILMSLMAGIFINLCLVAYIIGILYVFPMAFGPGEYDPPSLILSLIGIFITTVLAVRFYQQGHFIRAFVALYGWWLCMGWMLHRLFLRFWAS